jgi:rubrerythrin
VLVVKSEEKDLVTFLREQVKLEEQIVESVHNAVKDLKNTVVISVLKGIAFDSAKHADIYKAAESVVSVAQAMSDNELEKISKIVSWHIDAEEKLISRVNESINKTLNKKIKFLLESILADEKRHHELLKKIVETIVKGETITRDEWWEIMWRDVPTHGSPGG